MKTADKIKDKYGADHYQKIGSQGGKISTTGGFASKDPGADGMTGRERATFLANKRWKGEAEAYKIFQQLRKNPYGESFYEEQLRKREALKADKQAAVRMTSIDTKKKGWFSRFR